MTTQELIDADAPKTLFWLDTPSIVLSLGFAELRAYIEGEVFPVKGEPSARFMLAPIAFALKNRHHHRRVHVLDPMATLFLYDFVNMHSNLFQKDSNAYSKRRRFGYHFKGKAPQSGVDEHRQFRQQAIAAKKEFAYVAKVDIANCFASFYHHDIVSFVKSRLGELPSQKMGLFLRQIAAGRSISCFPQGYLPTKALGNLYLSFIDNSVAIESPLLLRYMDDIFIFSNSLRMLEEDVYRLQSIISERNLYLNSAKTSIGSCSDVIRLSKTAALRKSLLIKRQIAMAHAYDCQPEEVHLTSAEFKYLSGLISSEDVGEEDVELALALITDDAQHAERLARLVFEKYPHLVKNLYSHLARPAFDGQMLWELMENTVSKSFASEFLLFWIARIAKDIFTLDSDHAKMHYRIYEHPSATDVVRAAILEGPSIEFGLLEKKEAVLRNSGGSLLAMSAAVGLRNLEKAKRNQLYKYAASASPVMAQVTKALTKHNPS